MTGQPDDDHPTVEDFARAARTWLEANATRRVRTELRWGVGSDDVAVFAALGHDEERAIVEGALGWQRRKSDAGYGSIAWPRAQGGAGLTPAHAEAFRRLERDHVTPPGHEAVSISLNVSAPAIAALGTEEQRARWLVPLRRGDSLCCQLFSEPNAGSDLGALSTRAERDGSGWVVDGQKVWTTGAQFADLGYLVCRTDPSAPRQTGCTAFVVDMSTPGIEVRTLRQMSGGSSFNEVFLTGVRIPDADRLGEVGAGWAAAMTALGFERAAGAGGSGGGGGAASLVDRLIATARHRERDRDAIVRQELASAHIGATVRSLTRRRAADRVRHGGVPGAEGFIGKLHHSRDLTHAGEVAALILGERAVADVGEWGTFAWSELITGAPGMRIAGGTDEIQRNTIAERILGLPRDPTPSPTGGNGEPSNGTRA